MSTGENLTRVGDVPEINARLEIILASGGAGYPALIAPVNLIIDDQAQHRAVEIRQT